MAGFRRRSERLFLGPGRGGELVQSRR
jgi:hypothetical protein